MTMNEKKAGYAQRENRNRHTKPKYEKMIN